MGAIIRLREPTLSIIATVSCLACEAVYARPTQGSTAATNPGCPDCGYLGWRSVSVQAEPLRSRSVADPRHSLSG